MSELSTGLNVKVLRKNTLFHGRVGEVIGFGVTDKHPKTNKSLGEQQMIYTVLVMGETFEYLADEIEITDEPVTPEFQILVELADDKPKRGVIDC